MMLEKIQDALEVARKAKERQKVMWLSTLLAACLRKGKDKGDREPTDTEVIEAVGKAIENLDDALKYMTAEAARTAALTERAMLEQFMPQALTKDELTVEIDKLVAKLPNREPSQMGVVMGSLRQNFAGRFNGGEASTLVRQRMAAVPANKIASLH